jgi:hypothetical protein
MSTVTPIRCPPSTNPARTVQKMTRRRATPALVPVVLVVLLLMAVTMISMMLIATLASSSQAPSSTAEIKSPDLNLVLQRLEEVQHRDPARSRPYKVRREYKVFRGFDKQPTSEVMAQIDFVPPDKKTYKIIQTRGNSRGEKIVRELLDRETESAKKGVGSEITRANYDFVFLRQENFGVVPEYVLRIVPKRKDRYLLRGQTWVDASTFRIRRIEGVPAKSPSLWIKGIHITLQYAELGGMWVPISFDALLRSAS